MTVRKATSEIEELLALQLRALNFPHYVREYRFAAPRRWRADFAWPERLLIVEIEGGIWDAGRHVRGAGFIKDMEKYNEMTLLGFRLLRFDRSAVESGKAVKLIEQMLAM